MKEHATTTYHANPLDSPQTKQFWPEIKLWWAVLVQASYDVQLSRTKRKNLAKLKDPQQRKAYTRHYDSAMAWFHSKNENVGSFLWVCSNLGLHSETIRCMVLKYRIKLSMQWKDAREG